MPDPQGAEPATGPATRGAPAIGDAVPLLTFTDARYLRRSLADFGERQAYVLYFVTVGCPLVQRYLPKLAALAEELSPRGVQFLALNVGPNDSTLDAAAQGVTHDLPFPFVKDFDARVAAAVGAERSATAVVLDAQRRLRYRGRIDAQLRFTGTAPNPGRADLREALADVLERRDVRVAETPVEGCVITRPPPPRPNQATFTRDILPLLQRSCQDCHRDGGAGPFPLLDHDDVAGQAEMIAEVVTQGRMPPWYGAGDAHHFTNHRGLGADERNLLLGWIAAGTPKGDPADAPPPREFSKSEWRIETPDLVLEAPGTVRLPASGFVPYQHYVLPHVFLRDTWVEQIEILPANRRVLHHANLLRFRLGDKPSQDGFVTGQVPGGDAMILDKGTAVKVPAGSLLAIQAHYVTTGKPETDRLRVGLRFPRTNVQRQLQVMIATRTRFEIPPGAPAHRVQATRMFDADADGIGMVPHMHLRGRDMTYVAEYPDGRRETLLVVPSYSFDWQQSYRWADGARTFPKGTRIHVVAHFDNSAWNPFNPDPQQTVRFGLQTVDEMMYGFLFWTRTGEQLDLRIDPATGRVIP